MTTCPFCLDNMAARSERQLMVRRANIDSCPHVLLSTCPQCHGTEWATTDYMVDPDPPLAPVGVRRIVGLAAVLATVVLAILILPRIL